MWSARASATLEPMTDQDRDERALMPRTAPPAEIPRRHAAPPSPEERELATLERQLRALDRDIGAARRAAIPPRLGKRTRDDDAPPEPHGERVRLRDGADILIRPVEPADARQLNAGFERLGAVSRYRRFLTTIEHLTPSQLTYLTDVDHRTHEALAALDAQTGEGVGIARYVRDPADARLAEVAVVVTDAWQRRGVATALLQRLMARARAVGIERIAARLIVGNEAARRLFAHAADTVSERRAGGTILLTARLHD
jgi:RimJ/RimL family protein N-acetyltransferase